jgi:AraC-like DNA-binding protein
MHKEQATLYRTEKLDNLLVFKANYHRFQFSRHAHEDFALGLMEEGVQKIHCRGKEFCASQGSLITVNVDEVHDGMSANCNEYRYRILYIPFSLMQKIGSEMVSSKVSHYFRLPVTIDIELASRLRYLFHILEQDNMDLLEAQSVFYNLLAGLLARHGIEQTELPSAVPLPKAVGRARSFINDMALHDISLDDISTAAGLSRFHFLRVFTASQGITPHSFLLHRRLQLARESIRQGMSISDAALDCCFSDQSHFSRRFKSAYGITPKQYQKAVC